MELTYTRASEEGTQRCLQRLWDDDLTGYSREVPANEDDDEWDWKLTYLQVYNLAWTIPAHLF